MTARGDVIVIGAGIVGACCAWFLARDGWRVRIFDPRGIGGGASGAGMGHIVLMDEPDAEFAITHRSRNLWDEVLPRLPSEAGWNRCGTLWIASDEEEAAAARAKHQRLTRAGVEAQLLTASDIAALEPNLRTNLIAGLRIPGDSIVLPAIAARWLIEQSHATFEPAAARHIDSGRVLLDDGRELRADAIIIAAGIWIRDLIPRIPLRPRKGHLVMTDVARGFCTHQIVELGYIKNAHSATQESVSFNIQPRASGNLVIGSSRQFDVESADVEPRIIERMMTAAAAFMPAVTSLATKRTWTGLRAATPDGLPIIGEHPAMPGVYLAGGHEGLGLTLSMASGELIADALAGRTPSINPAPFSPARFLNPAL